MTPSTASEYAFILYPVKNAEAINRGERPASDLGVRAVDDYTLEVELERPTAYFHQTHSIRELLPCATSILRIDQWHLRR